MNRLDKWVCYHLHTVTQCSLGRPAATVLPPFVQDGEWFALIVTPATVRTVIQMVRPACPGEPYNPGERAVIVPHRINDRPADRHADGSTTADSTSHSDHPRTMGGIRLSVCNDVGCRPWRHRL